MTNLQKLLDEKFPITDKTRDDGRRLYTVWREIFTEGYNEGRNVQYEKMLEEGYKKPLDSHSAMFGE